MLLLIIVLVLVSVIYLYSIRNHDYWKKRNVKHDPPMPLFGNNYDIHFGNKSITQAANDLYWKYPNEKVAGFLKGSFPELHIRDPDIIRQILSVDFSHFYNRGFVTDKEFEPLALNLFTLDGDEWKLVRQRLTPAFTTAKLKNMYPLIVNCANKLQTFVEEDIIKGGNVHDVKNLMARFTTEFIGACGFGIEMDTINDENSLYLDLGRKIASQSKLEAFKIGLIDAFPFLKSYLHIVKGEVNEIMFEIIRRIVEQRNNKPSRRNDFIDLLIEIEAKGIMQGESISKFDANGKPAIVEQEFNFRYFVAQAFIFFAAGFETSSASTSYTLHQLAYNPDIQYRVQQEIDEVLSRYDNKLCYDAVSEMKLLSMCFKEALRMFPILGVLNRECTKKYTLPGTDVTIDPGVRIVIPVQAMHMDEKYYKNPQIFIPERFEADEVKQRHKFVYLPFGEGPRNCIGSRLGEMQSLAGLAAFLSRFSVEPAPVSKYQPKVDTKGLLQSIKGGLPLKINLRNV